MSCALAVVALTVGLIAAFGTPLWQDDGVGVSVALQSQLDPQIVSDGSSGAIVTWEDYRNSATTGYDIYAQRVDSNGNALWQTDGVSLCIASSSQSDPQIASDGSGGAIVTWQDQRYSDTTKADIYAQRMDSDGNVLWQTNGVSLCVASNDQYLPQIVSDGSGGAIVTWYDGRDFSTTGYDIYAQRVDGNGNVMWQTNGVSLCVTNYDQYSPQLVSDGSGGSIVTWRDQRDYGTTMGDIYAQRVDQDGNALWKADGVSLTVAPMDQLFPRIAPDGSGGAIVTWYDGRDLFTKGNDIYAQRVDSGGNTLWTLNGVSLCVAPNWQKDPQIASDGTGGAIVTWEDRRLDSIYDIYAQRVDADGKTLWITDGVTICAASNDQEDPQIVSDGSGGAIATWKDERSDSDGDIYVQRVDSDGNVLWQTDGVSLCVASFHQVVPQIVSDGMWGAIVTWKDNRENGYRDIYAQRVGVKPVRLPLVIRKYPG